MKLLRIVKNIITEEMISTINQWKENLTDHGEYFSTIIARDDIENHLLYLFIGFTPYGKFMQYSYSFRLFDMDGNEISDYLETRNAVKQHIPINLLGKGIITNIIEQMTRKLLEKIQPNLIIRYTTEALSGDSLIRYQRITDIMIKEFNYELISEIVNDEGITTWKLKKKDNTNLNENMDYEYELQHQYTLNERREIAWKPYFHLLKK